MSGKRQYKKRPGFRIKGDVTTVGKHIESLTVGDGELSPSDVLKDASDPKSPIHDEFEWDDTKAAREHRLHQARKLIRSFEVVWIEEQVEVQTVAFVSLQEDKKASYRSVRTVLTDDQLRAQWKEQALRDLRSWRAKYSHIKELSDVFKTIDGVL